MERNSIEMIRQDVLSSIWVGGFIGYGMLYRGEVNDANNAKQIGYYIVSRNGLNVPTPADGKITYIYVYPCPNYGFLQILIPYDNNVNELFYRRNFGEFGAWFKFNLVGL